MFVNGTVLVMEWIMKCCWDGINIKLDDFKELIKPLFQNGNENGCCGRIDGRNVSKFEKVCRDKFSFDLTCFSETS